MGATLKLESGRQGVTLARRIQKIQRAAKKAHVAAGYISGLSNNSSIKKARLNEFGHKNTPARPFMHQAVPIIANGVREVAGLFDTDTLDPMLVECGNVMRQGIRDSVETQNFEKLAPSTIRKKGHDYILVHKGVMYADVQSEIREGAA